ncbi:MAG: amino acid ABC transporter permease [Leptolyngbyaceae cyanobacterium CSU_1_4]|nr:amino acid ABC transporter permease [Leptolyngbyaceae cyanobacterium CSU_1_4]
MTTAHSPTASPPPLAQVGAIAWVRKNLLSNWFNTLLTIILVLVLGRTLMGFLSWATTQARWQLIPANLALFFIGRYPVGQMWRIWSVLALISALGGLSWGVLARNVPQLFSRTTLLLFGLVGAIAVLMPTPVPFKILLLAIEGLVLATAWGGRMTGHRIPKLGQWLAFAWSLSFLIVWWLIAGGLGLTPVGTSNWGGLMLTVFMAVVSILLCFPLGILLALGRQSNLPVIRALSVGFIEVVRGVPLIALLFVGSNMIPLFLPANIRPNLVVRAIIGLTLFSSAYLAENVRGGLQSIPRGQTEAANALGLNPGLTTGLIVLPQALKVSIPAMVGQFISLLQDTTLVSILGLFDLLGISRTILANPQFIGRYAEAYIFIGIIYWVFCYAMSVGSRQIEKQLNTEH